MEAGSALSEVTGAWLSSPSIRSFFPLPIFCTHTQGLLGAGSPSVLWFLEELTGGMSCFRSPKELSGRQAGFLRFGANPAAVSGCPAGTRAKGCVVLE